jgi:hypothetical protein
MGGGIPDIFYIDKFDYRRNNSVFTPFKVIYDDNLRPFFWNLGKTIDCFLSYTLFRKKVKIIEAGDYYYHLNKQKTVIGRHDDGTNFINMNGFSNIILYEMTFNKNYFFAKNFGFILKTDPNQSIPFKKFDTINSSGLSNTHVKLENPI